MTRPVLLVAVLALGWLAWVTPLRADSPGDAKAMAATNELYESGHFAEAAQVYEQLVDQGYESSVLYYNLGNAYFKQGDLGRAIVSYRRAERLAPRNPDIRANLEIARAQRIDLFDAGEGMFAIETAIFSMRWLTLDELARLALVLWFMLAVTVLVLLYARRRAVRRGARYAAVMVGLALLLSAGAMAGRWYYEGVTHEVVVVAEVVDVVSGPGTQYVKEFVLHGGTEARLLEQRGSWTRLALPGGDLQGWVPSTAVEEL